MPEAAVLAAAWPSARLGDAVEALGRRTRLTGIMQPRRGDWTAPIRTPDEGYVRMQGVARSVGLEAEPVEVAYGDIDRFLRDAPPVILAVPGHPGRALCVIRGRRKFLWLLTPGLAQQLVPLESVSALLRAPLEAAVLPECARAAAECGSSRQRAGAIRDALLRQLLVSESARGCWLLRPGREISAWDRLRQAGSFRRFGSFLLCHLLFVLLWLGSWLLLGQAVLQDRIGLPMLLPWALLIATLVPLRMMRTVLSGAFAIETGTTLKQRLLTGAGHLDPPSMRHWGVGQLLGRALEAEAMETLTLASGLVSLTAVLELVLAAAVLGQGAGGWLHSALLVAWVCGMLALAFRHHDRLRTWADARLELTHEAVESLVGHGTRLVQQRPGEWQESIDRLQTRYLSQCEAVDRLAVVLHSGVPRAWLVIGLLPVLPAFIAGEASAAALATALGGVLLAYRAFRELATGVDHASVAAVAWARLRALVQPADEELAGQAEFAASQNGKDPHAAESDTPLLEGTCVSYRHRSRETAAVDCAVVRIRRGDRILLEGASGSGKSTLGSLLSGNTVPASGVLLLGGLDLRTIGADHWRKRVVLVPQFHDNHLFMGSLAFNLLMGRDWPPSVQDLARAEEVCRALGLGELLDRMPSGLSQSVGETGWRLSHGEQSRVFIARAVLQQPEIMILDESLAALDSTNLNRVVCYLREQPSALVVIAHP